MLNGNKSSSIRAVIAATIVGLVLSVAALSSERNVSAVFVTDAASAPVAPMIERFDYFPSNFAAPTGEIEALPTQF